MKLLYSYAVSLAKGVYLMVTLPIDMILSLKPKIVKTFRWVRLKEDPAPVYLSEEQLKTLETWSSFEESDKAAKKSAQRSNNKRNIVNFQYAKEERRKKKERRNNERRDFSDRRKVNKIVPFDRRSGEDRRDIARRARRDRRSMKAMLSRMFNDDASKNMRASTVEKPVQVLDRNHTLITHYYVTSRGERCIHTNLDGKIQKTELRLGQEPGDIIAQSDQSQEHPLHFDSSSHSPIYVIAGGETTIHITEDSKGHLKIGSGVF